MEIEEALSNYLLAHASITALIGTRLYPDEPGNSLPSVIYTKVSDKKIHTLSGQASIESPVIKYSAYAETKNAAREISNAIKGVLNDYSGELSGAAIQYIQLIDEMSGVKEFGSGEAFVDDLEYQVFFIRS